MSAAEGSEPLAVLAGGGELPLALAGSVVASGRAIHIVGLKGEIAPGVERFPHTLIELGEIGAMLAAIKASGARELVIIGSLKRPDIKALRFDFGAVWNLPTILSLMTGGDDTLLTNVVRFFEGKGLTVRGAHEVAPDLAAPQGPLGSVAAGADARADIARGFAVVEALGPYDVGQAVVVTRGHVIAVEAAEGTDGMLERAASLRQWGRARSGKRGGVLVKRPKPGQELRVDMPVIGPRTVELAAEAGLAGIAIEAGHVLVASRSEVIARADAAKLFVVGIAPSAGAA